MLEAKPFSLQKQVSDEMNEWNEEAMGIDNEEREIVTPTF